MAKPKWFEDVQLFRTKRKQVGLTQHQLAKISKIDRAVIADIEAGRRKLTNDKVGEALWGALTLTEIRRYEDPLPLAVLNQAPGELGRKLVSVRPGALHAALGGPKPTEQEMEVFRAMRKVYRPENSRTYWVRFFVNGRTYEESSETESHSGALGFLEKRIEEELRESRERQKRQLAALEDLGIDAPIVSELIESFRREIAEKDKQLEEMNRALVKNGRAATT